MAKTPRRFLASDIIHPYSNGHPGCVVTGELIRYGRYTDIQPHGELHGYLIQSAAVEVNQRVRGF